MASFLLALIDKGSHKFVIIASSNHMEQYSITLLSRWVNERPLIPELQREWLANPILSSLSLEE